MQAGPTASLPPPPPAQIISCKGLGEDRLTNKHFTFRKTWSQLYHRALPLASSSHVLCRTTLLHFPSPSSPPDMKPGKMYWEFVILARKLCIVSSERRLP